MTTSVIETELVEASGFEPTKNYARQDYLAALARVVNDMDEKDYDNLTVEAQDWFNAAVRALNKKQDLPEFADVAEDDDGEAESEESDTGSDDAGDGESEDNTGDDTDDGSDEDPAERKSHPRKQPKAKKSR